MNEVANEWSKNPRCPLLITGEKGSGKLMLACEISRLDESKVVVSMNQAMMLNTFNSYLDGADIVVLTLDAGCMSRAMKVQINKFFENTVGADVVMIHEKGVEPRDIVNNIAWIIVAESFDVPTDYTHIAL